MGVYASVSKAKATGGTRNHLKTGEYIIVVNSMGEVFPRAINNVKQPQLFAVNGKIVASNSSDPLMAVGNAMDWATSAKHDTYFGNVKAFLCAVMDLTESEYGDLGEVDGERISRLMMEEHQVYAGRLVTASCVPNDKGNIYPSWGPVKPEQQPEDVRFTPQEVLEAYKAVVLKPAAA